MPEVQQLLYYQHELQRGKRTGTSDYSILLTNAVHGAKPTRKLRDQNGARKTSKDACVSRVAPINACGHQSAFCGTQRKHINVGVSPELTGAKCPLLYLHEYCTDFGLF